MQRAMIVALVGAVGTGLAIGTQATLNTWLGRLVGPIRTGPPGELRRRNPCGSTSARPGGHGTTVTVWFIAKSAHPHLRGVRCTRSGHHWRDCLFSAPHRDRCRCGCDLLRTDARRRPSRQSRLGRHRRSPTKSGQVGRVGIALCGHLIGPAPSLRGICSDTPSATRIRHTVSRVGSLLCPGALPGASTRSSRAGTDAVALQVLAGTPLLG